MKLWVQMKFHNLLFEWPNWTMSTNIPRIGVQSWALGQAALSHTMEGWGGKRGMPPSPLHNTWQCKPAMPPWAMAIEVNNSPNPPHWAGISTSDIEEVFSLIFTLSLSSPLLPASLMVVIKERVSVARNDLSHNQINSGHRIGLTKNNNYRSSQQMDVASTQRTLSRTMERWGECVELFITTHVHHESLSPPQYMTVSHCRPHAGRWKEGARYVVR